MPPLVKFNNLFNKHFHYLMFFKSILSRKNWQSGLLLVGTGKVNGYSSCYCLKFKKTLDESLRLQR